MKGCREPWATAQLRGGLDHRVLVGEVAYIIYLYRVNKHIADYNQQASTKFGVSGWVVIVGPLEKTFLDLRVD